MNLAALKTEIQTGPLAAELAPFVLSGSDAEIAKRLNRADIAAFKSVVLADVVQYLSDLGVLANIADAAANPADPAHAAARKVVATLRLSTELGVQTLNMRRTSNTALITGLVTAGLMTVAQANGLRALADTLLGRGGVLWNETVTHEQVGQALRGVI